LKAFVDQLGEYKQDWRKLGTVDCKPAKQQ